jgi:aspartyl/asparaginyl-tRNA synthetase
MTLGPYINNNGKITYTGNKIFEPIDDVRGICAPNMSDRAEKCRCDKGCLSSLIRLYNGLFTASKEFMDRSGALLFDLPITTRMISSPGALKKTIISDVEPFEINFFNNKTYLTQSSQLYLEFAITTPGIDQVWCWDKSFRMEKADFRHLPEFTHIEFEGNCAFEENLKIQENYLKHIIKHLIEKIMTIWHFFWIKNI